MRPLDAFRGTVVVARQEFLGNLRSIRFVIMALILALVVVGGSYGFSAAAGGFNVPPVMAWGHPAYAADGSSVAVVWVSSAFGRPEAGATVDFVAFRPDRTREELGSAVSDARGFASLPVGNHTFVTARAQVGTLFADTTVLFEPMSNASFSFRFLQLDLDGDGLQTDLAIHAVTRSGEPAATRFLQNGTRVGDADANGFGLLQLPPGTSEVTVEYGAEQAVFPVEVSGEPTGPVGPDLALLITAAVFVYLVVPIFAIVISFDAVSKERVQGTLDLLLSRPATRTGVFLGKALGAFGAVAVPVTLVNVAGVGVISATSGEGPTGGFAAAFLGLTLLLIVFYVLLQLIFSSLAKTSGTAVLFGVLVWLLFNILYNVVVLILGNVLFPSDLEGQFRFQMSAGLGNPSAIYQQLVFLSAPTDLGGFFGGSTVGAGAAWAAAAAWFALLLLAGWWVFRRKASE